MSEEAATKTAGAEVLYQSTLDTSESEMLEKIYKFSDDMAAAKEYTQYTADFKYLLGATSSRAKTLVATLIPKYAAHFPDLQAEALEAVIGLCADEQNVVRLNAIKGLPALCKGADGKPVAAGVHKACSLLIKMETTKPTQEVDLRAASTAMDTLIKMDVQNVCEYLLSSLEAPEGEEQDALRDVACKVLKDKVWSKAAELLRPFEGIEEFLKGRIEKVLYVASESEFKLLIDILKGLKIFEAGQKYGPQGLADIIAEQALLPESLDPTAVDELTRVLECVNIAMPFLKKGATDNKMSLNMVEKILPVFDKFDASSQASILQRLCQLAFFVPKEAAGKCAGPVFTLLMAQLPAPKAPEAPAEAEGDNAAASLPEITFPFVEAFLFLVHLYGAKDPATVATVSGIPLDDSENPDAEKFQAFKDKVLYTYEVGQTVMGKLQAVAPKAKSSRTPEDLERKKALERGMTSIKNISDMTRLLVTGKPSCLQGMPSGKFSWHTGPATSHPLKRAAAASGAEGGAAKKAYVPLSRRGGAPTHKA